MESMDNKSVARGSRSRRCCRRDVLTRLMERYLQPLLRFLLFADEGKHKVITNLSPIHAVIVFYYCLFAPAIAFFLLLPYGLLALLAGETTIVIATLEILHIIYDR